MMKTATTRWNETIAYLNARSTHEMSRIGDHINSIVTGGMRDGISKEIALGNTAGVHSSAKAFKGARDALRALLLCQRVYFSDLWAKTTFVGGDTIAGSMLDQNWKAKSLGFWGLKNDFMIDSAIAMFATVPGASADHLSEVAQQGPPTGQPPAIAGNLFVSRNNFPVTGPAETCYRGVLAWLLKSGVISFRWFMQNSAPSGSKALNELFGDGEDVWPGQAFKSDSVLPAVQKGFIVHMWMEDSGEAGWNGHWVISNGDGTFCGVNNGEVNDTKTGEVVLKKYTKTGKLRTQFEGYAELVEEKANSRGFMDIVRTGAFARARMVKFDPLQLKHRM